MTTKEYKAAWYKKNKKRLAAKAKLYYLEHAEEAKARSRAWREVPANRRKERARNKRRPKRDPEYFRLYRKTPNGKRNIKAAGLKYSRNQYKKPKVRKLILDKLAKQRTNLSTPYVKALMIGGNGRKIPHALIPAGLVEAKRAHLVVLRQLMKGTNT